MTKATLYSEHPNLVVPATSQGIDALIEKHERKRSSVGMIGKWISTLRNKPTRSGEERVSNPALANITDLVPWDLYDRVTTAAAANTATLYTFFQQPIGTNSKTKADTNLEQVMRLPDPEWMDVQKIAFSIAPNMTSADIFQLLALYYWEFWVGGKIYAEGPLEIASSMTGLYGSTTRVTESVWGLGNPNNNDGGFDLRLPAGIQLTDANGNVMITDGIKGCRILQGQQFQVKLQGTAFALAATGGTFGTGLNLRCHLKGVKSRIAQ